MCINREHTCDAYNITIPDIDVINGRILQRSNLFYYQWKRPNSTIELQTTGSCDNLKLYVTMKNATRGELILSFTPSLMVVIMYHSGSNI